MFEKYLRKNIRDLVPYSSARDEYSGTNAIFLDANENPYNAPYNRYPDPLQSRLKVKIARLKNVSEEQIFLGNGSDEAIDITIRAFCEPGIDKIIGMKPSYGMYKVCADINNVQYVEIPLTKDYQIDKEALFDAVDWNTKLIFLCSPNNPTSNSMYREDIVYILENFEGIVALDEAYIDFSTQPGFLRVLNDYPNLVIYQTFSKAWGLAGIRLGAAYANKELIRVFTRMKYPYNINSLTQETAINMLEKEEMVKKWVKEILDERERMHIIFSGMSCVTEILPSDSNFLMVRFKNAKDIYRFLLEKEIILRDRSKVLYCEGCLRITIGLKEENNKLIDGINDYQAIAKS
jgi:histidinol-phosphate aminotransferase